MSEQEIDMEKPNGQNGAMVVRDHQPVARAQITREALNIAREQRVLLKEYVEGQMVEGTDFGIIPGTNLPTLLKPGAEKLIDLFNAEPTYDIIDKIVDFERRLYHFEFRCQLRSRETGAKLAEGYGSCSSREGKYRYRKGQRLCPECQQPTIIKGREEYGGGWVCWSKEKQACGAKFPDGAVAIEGQVVGRVDNDDIESLINTVMKMGKKRAQVDGAIALARCSDLFTQDCDDDADRGRNAKPANAKQLSKQQPKQQPKQQVTKPPAQPKGPVDDRKTLEAAIKGAKTLEELGTIPSRVKASIKAKLIKQEDRVDLGRLYLDTETDFKAPEAVQ